MQTAPKTAELADKAGISLSYASEIASGSRTPSRSLAVHIFRRTGWKHGLIANLSSDQIDLLEAIDPWKPRPESAAA